MILKSTLVVQEESRSPAPLPLTSKPLPEKIPLRDLSSVEKATARHKQSRTAFGGSRPRNCMITYDVYAHLQPKNAYE